MILHFMLWYYLILHHKLLFAILYYLTDISILDQFYINTSVASRLHKSYITSRGNPNHVVSMHTHLVPGAKDVQRLFVIEA